MAVSFLCISPYCPMAIPVSSFHCTLATVTLAPSQSFGMTSCAGPKATAKPEPAFSRERRRHCRLSNKKRALRALLFRAPGGFESFHRCSRYIGKSVMTWVVASSCFCFTLPANVGVLNFSRSKTYTGKSVCAPSVAAWTIAIGTSHLRCCHANFPEIKKPTRCVACFSSKNMMTSCEFFAWKLAFNARLSSRRRSHLSHRIDTCNTRWRAIPRKSPPMAFTNLTCIIIIIIHPSFILHHWETSPCSSQSTHQNNIKNKSRKSPSTSATRQRFVQLVAPFVRTLRRAKKNSGTRKNCQCNCHQNHQNTKTPAKWFEENASPASNMEIFWGINNHHRDLWKVESCCTLPS